MDVTVVVVVVGVHTRVVAVSPRLLTTHRRHGWILFFGAVDIPPFLLNNVFLLPATVFPRPGAVYS